MERRLPTHFFKNNLISVLRAANCNTLITRNDRTFGWNWKEVLNKVQQRGSSSVEPTTFGAR